jgi:allantoin racemase
VAEDEEMKIRVVTPVVEQEILEIVRGEYVNFASSNTEITISGIKEYDGPGLPGPHDPAVVAEMVERVQEAELEGMDAVVLDCMGDPGLATARRLVSIPVVGPAEASCHLALCLGANFSVVTMEEDVVLMKEVATRYGMEQALVSVRVMDITLEELAFGSGPGMEPFVEAALKAVTEDGAHVVISGCNATVGLSNQVAQRLADIGHSVPVLEPSWIALDMAESLVRMGITHTKRSYASVDIS